MNSNLINKIASTDWDCLNADTQYLTHSIHRYSGKFIPQIAKQVIELISDKGDTVLDPYCGSGTTLLESSLLGRHSIGVDLNPLAILISKVKTTPINKSELNKFDSFLVNETHKYLSSNQLSILESNSERSAINQSIFEDERWTNPWYKKWFNEKSLFQLIGINQAIANYPDETCRNLALVAFSDILRRSSNAHSSYPNVMFDKNKKTNGSPITLFLKRFKEVSEDVLSLDKKISEKFIPKVVLGNARELAIKNSSIDVIVTHPPYIASVPYAEYGQLSITWLGSNPRDLDKELTGGRRQSKNVVKEFEQGFKDMINESYRVLKKGGKFFMLLGNPVVKGKQVDIIRMSTELSLEAGLKILVVTQRNGINRRANKMGAESLLFFYK